MHSWFMKRQRFHGSLGKQNIPGKEVYHHAFNLLFPNNSRNRSMSFWLYGSWILLLIHKHQQQTLRSVSTGSFLLIWVGILLHLYCKFLCSHDRPFLHFECFFSSAHTLQGKSVRNNFQYGCRLSKLLKETVVIKCVLSHRDCKQLVH